MPAGTKLDAKYKFSSIILSPGTPNPPLETQLQATNNLTNSS